VFGLDCFDFNGIFLWINCPCLACCTEIWAPDKHLVLPCPEINNNSICHGVSWHKHGVPRGAPLGLVDRLIAVIYGHFQFRTPFSPYWVRNRFLCLFSPIEPVARTRRGSSAPEIAERTLTRRNRHIPQVDLWDLGHKFTFHVKAAGKVHCDDGTVVCYPFIRSRVHLSRS